MDTCRPLKELAMTTKLMALAVLLFASSAAQAGETFSFDIGGRNIRIETPDDCDSPSCVSVSIPGIYESGPKRPKQPRPVPQDERATRDPDVRQAPAPRPAPTTASPSLEPANGAATAGRDAPPSAPAPVAAPAPSAVPVAPPAAEAERAPPPQSAPSSVVATAPASPPAQPAPPTINPSSPMGIWLTEPKDGKEGKVRIEACGEKLCGYSLDSKTGQNRTKVLIDMKPQSSGKWAGRIHDPSSGSDYDSTIALKGGDTLQVRGCAFGGMFCGGQTWTRVN
jgi:uncharacterized protein (DUF2147 family)